MKTMYKFLRTGMMSSGVVGVGGVVGGVGGVGNQC